MRVVRYGLRHILSPYERRRVSCTKTFWVQCHSTHHASEGGITDTWYSLRVEMRVEVQVLGRTHEELPNTRGVVYPVLGKYLHSLWQGASAFASVISQSLLLGDDLDKSFSLKWGSPRIFGACPYCSTNQPLYFCWPIIVFLPWGAVSLAQELLPNINHCIVRNTVQPLCFALYIRCMPRPSG